MRWSVAEEDNSAVSTGVDHHHADCIHRHRFSEEDFSPGCLGRRTKLLYAESVSVGNCSDTADLPPSLICFEACSGAHFLEPHGENNGTNTARRCSLRKALQEVEQRNDFVDTEAMPKRNHTEHALSFCWSETSLFRCRPFTCARTCRTVMDDVGQSLTSRPRWLLHRVARMKADGGRHRDRHRREFAS